MPSYTNSTDSDITIVHTLSDKISKHQKKLKQAEKDALIVGYMNILELYGRFSRIICFSSWPEQWL